MERILRLAVTATFSMFETFCLYSLFMCPLESVSIADAHSALQPGEADEQLTQSKKFKKGSAVVENANRRIQPQPVRYQPHAGKVLTGAVLVSTNGRAIPIATTSPLTSDSSR
jgi:hypothetical protein